MDGNDENVGEHHKQRFSLGGHINDYQSAASSLAVYPGQGSIVGLSYVGLKLAGEAGEAAEKIGKCIRDDDVVGEFADGIFTFGAVPEERKEALKKELGDVLWYVSAAASELGFTLGEIAQGNLDKLYDRRDRGVLQGSGDDR
jgi:NTP pyrophosphatase (non-canonical NTP hydrolase)